MTWNRITTRNVPIVPPALNGQRSTQETPGYLEAHIKLIVDETMYSRAEDIIAGAVDPEFWGELAMLPDGFPENESKPLRRLTQLFEGHSTAGIWTMRVLRDSPRSGGTGKFVEIVARVDVPDEAVSGMPLFDAVERYVHEGTANQEVANRITSLLEPHPEFPKIFGPVQP